MYGSTIVVMAIYGLHWKLRSLTPCQRHPSEPNEKIFGTIDHVIDLNNVAKLSFAKIFRDWGTYTKHIVRVCAFFSFLFYFLRSLTRVQPKRLNRFWYAISRTTPFGERMCLFMIEKNRFLTLIFERSKSAILFGFQNLYRHYLENGTRKRDGVHRNQIGSHIWPFEW